MHVLEILGTGCCDCLRLGLLAAQAADEAGVEAEIRHITDQRRIEAYGVLEPPGLAIDGTVASTGRVPAVTELVAWLRDADRTLGSHLREVVSA